jgi:surfactin family lipopeptide synthetase A
MDRSPALLAALLGIWKAGAAYLPLDPALPPERLRSVLQDAEPRFVLTEKRYAPLLSAHAPRVLCASRISTQRRTPASCSAIALSADSLAYVLYTSGSTGKPKGVEVCHGGLANVVTALAEQLQLRSGEVLLAHSSLGFDVSNLEMYLPLVSGGSVHLAENGCLLVAGFRTE